MKHTQACLLLLLQLLCFSLPALSQSNTQTVLEPSLKFGKPSSEELSLTAFAPDTSAVAIVLYRTGITKFTYQMDDFGTTTECCVKIKILKSEGLRYADVTLPYYVPEKSTDKRENITEVEAFSYNLENGKTIRAATGKEFIVRERVNDKYMQLKFSIPSVRVGSVIEYRYKQSSDFYHHIDNWAMQDEIPVLFNEYNINLPRIFDFNAEMRGPSHIRVAEKEGSMQIIVRGNSSGYAQPDRNLSLNTRNLTLTSRNLPALRQDESFLWCPDDHKIQVSFELKGIQYPNTPYKPYTQAWEDIDKVLLKDAGFGAHLSLPNPYREEMKALQVMQLSKEERVGCLLRLLRQKLVWNGEYGLFCYNFTKSIAKGSGTNAELNFVLMSMMREAGLSVYPVVLSRRSTGILPVTYPSIQKLNTYIIGIEMDDQKMVFVDSSMGGNSYLNLLPVNLMAPQARIIGSERNDKWVDLSKIGNSLTAINLKGNIQADGTIAGVCNTDYSGQASAAFRREYFAAKDSAAYVEKRSANDNCQISQYCTEGVDKFADKVKETFAFSKQAGYASNEYLYINPLIFPHISKNPFIQTDRQLPVQMPHPYSIRLLSVLTLPEGYSVEELPKPGNIRLNDKEITCRYTVQTLGNQINAIYTFSLNQFIFPSEIYAQLQKVWENIAQKNNEMLVLKKTK